MFIYSVEKSNYKIYQFVVLSILFPFEAVFQYKQYNTYTNNIIAVSSQKLGVVGVYIFAGKLVILNKGVGVNELD
jgi:hypothetical protein